MFKPKITVEQVDALLPQTQCRQCDYAGCQPYAEAIVNRDEAINRCLPGGETTRAVLAELLGYEAAQVAELPKMPEQPKMLASIREAECIGCTKCIQACPIDAIMGAAKQMHTILSAECTGCGLCVEPCPMDCIDLIPVTKQAYQPQQAKRRYIARNQRLAALKTSQDETGIKPSLLSATELSAKKLLIQEAVARVKAKRQQPK